MTSEGRVPSVEALRHTVEVFHDQPDDWWVLIATSDSQTRERTGLTMGDLRSLLAVLDA